MLDHKRYAKTLRLALGKAKIDRPVRPFHDGWHTAITNDAAAGNAPLAVMKRAGHTDFKTTQLYIDLAGETFREEAERLEERLWGVRLSLTRRRPLISLSAPQGPRRPATNKAPGGSATVGRMGQNGVTAYEACYVAPLRLDPAMRAV